jgi:hypothetical protein
MSDKEKYKVYIQFSMDGVATQFLTHVLINFQKNSKIAKNIENKKKIRFLIYLHRFLAFLASSQKNLNFQRYLERVQLFTRHF